MGEHKIQGVDYVYTLQGWLKGFNGSRLDPTTEAGLDGDPGTLHSTVSRDVMAYTLGYNSVDYKPIGGSASSAFDGTYSTSSSLSTGNGLYNGNISFTTVSLNNLNAGQTAGYTYGYDQLNRLVKMRRHTMTGGQAWNNTSIIEDYKENIQYDANGNILSYQRNGSTTGSMPLAMDDLTYHYQTGTNKLTSLSDGVPSGNYSADIDQQSVNNYTYDAIGNMVKDKAAGVSKINWTVYGKIKSIQGLNHNEYGYSADGNRIRKTSGDSTTFYLLDASGNQLATYKHTPAGFSWNEQVIYGSSRLGVWRSSGSYTGRVLSPVSALDTLSDSYMVGGRIYELSNHLGNVLSTLSDKKIGISLGGGVVAHYEAEAISQQDYYPFGMLQPGRQFSLGSSYRYGFNGKENDNEVKGEGNQQDYGKRVYDPRIGKFLSTDPLTKSFPWYTPYQFAGNTPIQAIDLDGSEEYHYLLSFNKQGKSQLTFIGMNEIGYAEWTPTWSDWGKKTVHINEERRFTVHTGQYYEGSIEHANSVEFVSYEAAWTYSGFYDFTIKASGLTQKDVDKRLSLLKTGTYVAKVAAIWAEESRSGHIPFAKRSRAPKTNTVYRTQGGEGANQSQSRVLIGENGNVRIKGNEMLYIVLDDKDHSVYFYNKRGGAQKSASIASFQIPKSLADEIRANAVPQAQGRTYPWLPQVSDPTKSTGAFGVPKEYIHKLRQQAIQGSGKTETP